MMVTDSQGSGGENLLLPIWLVKNIRCCSDGRDSNTVANRDFVHCYFHGMPRPSARIVQVPDAPLLPLFQVYGTTTSSSRERFLVSRSTVSSAPKNT